MSDLLHDDLWMYGSALRALVESRQSRSGIYQAVNGEELPDVRVCVEAWLADINIRLDAGEEIGASPELARLLKRNVGKSFTADREREDRLRLEALDRAVAWLPAAAKGIAEMGGRIEESLDPAQCAQAFLVFLRGDTA